MADVGPGYSGYYDEDGFPIPFGEEEFADLFVDTTASEFDVEETDATGEDE